MVALVLAGHGSHISPDTAGVVWSYVDQLRAWSVADEITACFWKEAPAFRHVIDTVKASEIVVVPLFTAQGYFSKTVIPSEMNLDGSRTERNGRIIHYTPTLGEHPALSTIVQERIESVLAHEELCSDQVAVAIIGHGTSRNRASQNAAHKQAEALQHFASEVVAVFLDDEPRIAKVYELTTAPNIIAVPYFLATGSHVTQDVPQALGIQGNNRATIVKGRRIYYTEPIGTHESIYQLILDLARSTKHDFPIQASSDKWTGFPKGGDEQLINAVCNNSAIQFGQLLLTPTEVLPVKAQSQPKILETPAALRQHIRENPFRPLATSTDLPQDWRIPVASPRMLPAIVETIYPGGVADWAHQGEFQAESLRAFGEQQAGMFKDIHVIPESTIDLAVETICGSCIRFPTWHTTSRGDIPCKSPCNWWLTQVKEAIA